MPAQIITPSPPCCRLNQVGAAQPCATHPRDHPSEPSSVARISSVKRTRLKSCFRYWIDHAWRFSLWILVSGDLLGDFFVELQVDSIWHRVFLFTPEIPHASKTACWFEGDSSSLLSKAVIKAMNSPALWVWPWISWFSLSGPYWHCWPPS